MTYARDDLPDSERLGWRLACRFAWRFICSQFPGEMGYHALHYAAFYGEERSLGILRRAGASLKALTDGGFTPAEIAEANITNTATRHRCLRGLGVVGGGGNFTSVRQLPL